MNPSLPLISVHPGIGKLSQPADTGTHTCARHVHCSQGGTTPARDGGSGERRRGEGILSRQEDRVPPCSQNCYDASARACDIFNSTLFSVDCTSKRQRKNKKKKKERKKSCGVVAVLAAM